MVTHNSYIQKLCWIKIILTNPESCVMNGGVTTKYFPLESGAV